MIVSISSSVRRVAWPFLWVFALAAFPLSASEPPAAGFERGPDTREISILPSAAGQPLDLDACVRIALSENPELRAATETVAASAESVGVARAAYYPEVSFDGRYRRFDTHVFLPSGLPVEDTTLGATNDWSAGLTIGYSLFDSGVRRSELRAAAAGVEASTQDSRRVGQDVVFSVHRAFYRLSSADAWLTAARARESRARDHLRLAETLQEAGAVPHADVLRARVEHADARLAVVQAESEVTIAQGDLATAMGLPASSPITVRAPDPAPEELLAPDPEDALEKALASRPELATARERIQAAKHHASAVKGSYGPRVDAEVALGTRDSELLPEDEDWSVGLAVRIPLFTGYAKKHRVERAALETKVLEAEAEALTDRVEQEVWAAASDLASAAESVRQTEEILSEAKESLAFSRARYRAGAGTINDLLDAESALTHAESTQVAAVLAYGLANSRLLRAQGEL